MKGTVENGILYHSDKDFQLTVLPIQIEQSLLMIGNPLKVIFLALFMAE